MTSVSSLKDVNSHIIERSGGGSNVAFIIRVFAALHNKEALGTAVTMGVDIVVVPPIVATQQKL
jgi:hypothetical protein